MYIKTTIIAGALLSITTLGTVQAAPSDRHYEGNRNHTGYVTQDHNRRSQGKRNNVRHGNRKSQKHQVARSNSRHGVTHKPAIKKHKRKHKNRHRKFYRVRPGDNLHRISRKTGVGVKKLIRLNRNKLSSRNHYRLRVGQRLRLHRR